MKETRLDYYFSSMEEFTFKGVFDDCETPWDAIKNIDNFLQENIIKNDVKVNKAQMGEFVSIAGNYFIDEGTNIHANVVIEGPVMIGKNVTIQSGALIRPGSIIGDNCVVGHCCEVKHSIVQNKAKVQSFTFIGDSIIGKSTRVGSGAILANRRFDQQNITVKINEQKFNTGTDFFGSVLGDNTRLGANSTAVPGTLVGQYCWILPTVQVRGFVPKQKRIYPCTNIKIEDNPKIDLK